MDPFAQLPNELLQEVFKCVQSLSDKFKLAAVNKKFRGAILKVMQQEPMPLKINFDLKTINGCEVPVNRWPAAVEVLAQRTRFSLISFDCESPAVLNTILNILNGTHELHEVKAFYIADPCNSALLEQVLGKCDQLEELSLEFPLSQLPKPSAQAVDLGTVLNGKALSFLSLVLDEYPVQQLSAAFQSLAENTLHKLIIESRHPVDLVQLMGGVPEGLWSALTSLHLLMLATNDAQLGLFGIAARMPLLQNCATICLQPMIVPLHEFIDSVVLLFNNNQQARATQLMITHTDIRLVETSGCAVFQLVRVLQQQHPQLQAQLDPNNGRELRLTLGNITFVWSLVGAPSCADMCEECCSFYPNVALALLMQAERTHTSGHLQDYRLDRCSVERIVQDQNTVNLHSEQNYLILSSVLNEAQDLATITFEMEGYEQFYITVDSGPCFSSSCMVCLED